MKNKYILIALCCGVMAFQSCKKGGFLDPKIEPLTEEKVFADSASTLGFLSDLYAFTGMDIVPYTSTYFGTMNDNFETLTTNVAAGYGSSPQATFIGGTQTPDSHYMNIFYTTYYKKIRNANIFLKNISKTPISNGRKTLAIAEAKFLRAWYYFALVRLYGGVQLMGDEAIDDLPAYEYKRNTYKECVDYIVKELDDAAAVLLPASQLVSADYGRATSGACKAVKARVLLTAASPLFNGSPASTIANVAPLIAYSVTKDETLWQKAADALKQVVDNTDYALVEDNTTKPGFGFYNMFINGRKNTEYIYVYNIANGKDLETFWLPRSRTSQALTFSNPSENLVKAFGMKDGKAITDASSAYPYNPENPYVNRDPRFNYSIIFNQALLANRTTTAMQPVDIYYTANPSPTGAPIPAADRIEQYYTRTGYYTRKMCNTESPYASLSVQRAYPVIRLAEMILGYAEALNEMNQTELAVTYVNMIRKRAGIEPGSNNRYGIATGISKDNLRSLIQNEYRIELFQEGHWYYDCRRWKIAEVVENQTVTGTSILKQLDGKFAYSSITVLSPAFNTRMYLAPLPLAEVLKGKGSLIQNPGW
ncbi:RagB/SusD family nutrient uptake outer membrane protein [Pedobacter frigoris]|nr:RagB/SusD family nutrient uptake outer membrane protein [Pedobacter frigoris]